MGISPAYKRERYPAFFLIGEIPLVYLDSAATAQTHQVVCESIDQYYRSYHANVYRSVSQLGEESTTAYESARAAIARFIGSDPTSFVFTGGATEGINIIGRSWCAPRLTNKSTILITQAEHHANFIVWQQLALTVGAQLVILPLLSDFTIDISTVGDIFAQHSVVLTAVTLDSNVLGPVWGSQKQKLYELRELCRQANVPILLDGAQAVGHTRIDVRDLDPDFCVFSAHKMGGPTGVGGLYIASRRHGELSPSLYGGGMVYSVTPEESTWREMPQFLEAGTQPLAEIIAWGKLCEELATYDYELIATHETNLTLMLLEGLSQIPGITILGNRRNLLTEGHLVTFYHDRIHAHDLVSLLGDRRCVLRGGDHCAQPLSQFWGGRATVRASVFMYTTTEEITYFLEVLADICLSWQW